MANIGKACRLDPPFLLPRRGLVWRVQLQCECRFDARLSGFGPSIVRCTLDIGMMSVLEWLGRLALPVTGRWAVAAIGAPHPWEVLYGQALGFSGP